MPRPTRTNTTLLLVCEGYAEVELVRVVREIYLPRNCGKSLKAENRRGHGGAAALDMAIQLRSVGGYDRFGVLIDTDRHWTDDERTRASHHAITVVECIPCLEAMLFMVDGRNTAAKTADNKREFERAYGGPANRRGVIERNFPRTKFDSARLRVDAVDQLLTFLGV